MQIPSQCNFDVVGSLNDSAPLIHPEDLASLHDQIRHRINSCSYAYYFHRITWSYRQGTLTLHGSVPTFYLKQVLQTLLRDLTHVDRLRNEVDVVSSNGLSTVRPR